MVAFILSLSPFANPPMWHTPLQDGVPEFIGQVAVLHLIVIGLPILVGIRRGRGHPDDIYRGVIMTQVGATMMIALGEAFLAVIVAATQANTHATSAPPSAPARENWNSFGTFVFSVLCAYLILMVGLALTWRGWAEILTLAVRRHEWLGVAVLPIAVLPLVATFAYADCVWDVFGFVIPFGDAAEIIQDAAIRSIPTYLALDPWVIGVLALLTPLAVIAYGTWWRRRTEAAILAVRRAQ